MAIQFMDGFDHYAATQAFGAANGKWPGADHLGITAGSDYAYPSTLSMTTGRFGGQAACLGGGGPGPIVDTIDYAWNNAVPALVKTFPVSQWDFVIGFAFMYSDTNTMGTSVNNFLGLSPAGTPSGEVLTGMTQTGWQYFDNFWLSMGGGGEIVMGCADLGFFPSVGGPGEPGTAYAVSSISIPVNTWAYIEIAVLGSNDASLTAGAAMWIDGNVACVLPPRASSPGSTLLLGPVGTIFLRPTSTNATNTYFDDFYYNSIDGITARLGPQRIETLFPTSAGTHTGFTPTGGLANWQCVKDPGSVGPDGDTTDTSSSTSTTKDSFTMGTLAGTPTTISAVQTGVWWGQGTFASTTRTIAALVRSGGTDTVATDVGSGSSAYASTSFVLAPSGVAWTPTNLASAEFGYELVS